jgi:ABC-type uncharacterized transport system permease subunit
MSLICIVDKLEETQLQDRLVRCVVNLQNDAEASIRTNATIFLGKIAPKLKEPVRYVVDNTWVTNTMRCHGLLLIGLYVCLGSFSAYLEQCKFVCLCCSIIGFPFCCIVFMFNIHGH